MRPPFRRGVRVPDEVLARTPLDRGERVLAGAAAADGSWLLGTRDALLLVPASQSVEPAPPVEPVETVRVPWEQVQHVDWDRDSARLRVLEVGEYGRVRPEHHYRVEDPGLLLELVRERVTASVVLQRRVTVADKRGLNVIARRPPRGSGEVTWAYEFDEGVDPEDPAVQELAERGLATAAEELGLS
jgi:hypothetical protein